MRVYDLKTCKYVHTYASKCANNVKYGKNKILPRL